MSDTTKLKPEELATRAHDITVCLEGSSVADFDLLTTLGMAVRLALHLRGVPAVSYDIIRNVCVYLLDIPAAAVRPVLEFLAEAEFIVLDKQGATIKTIIPTVPYYDALFQQLGDLAQTGGFSEPEQLTLALVNRLALSPLPQDYVYKMGAEKKLADRIIDIGKEGSFILAHRARGRNILLSPTYFSEDSSGYADLTASSGASRISKMLDLLRQNQGWPLSKIISEKEIGGITLDAWDIGVIRSLAGEGFIPPPAIQTKHAGTNYFMFGPRPGPARLPPTKRHTYESAMALVAAVRQGQLLPAKYAIRSPAQLLRAFRDRKYLNANTEAIEQYRQVTTLRVAQLELQPNGYAKLLLIDRPENVEAVEMAINMVSGSTDQITPRDEVTLALRQGEQYIESLIGRKRIVEQKPIEPDPETRAAIDAYLLRGRE